MSNPIDGSRRRYSSVVPRKRRIFRTYHMTSMSPIERLLSKWRLQRVQRQVTQVARDGA